MIEIVLCVLASFLIMASCAIYKPDHAACPHGWVLPLGVRTIAIPGQPVGWFMCQRPPLGGDDDVITGKDTAIEQPGELVGRIHCTGGTRPIQVNYRTVGCQR